MLFCPQNRQNDLKERSKMAENTAVPSSVDHTNFIVNNIDIKLLNDQAYLIYDGTRIKWQHDLRSLKNFVENVAGLIGK